MMVNYVLRKKHIRTFTKAQYLGGIEFSEDIESVLIDVPHIAAKVFFMIGEKQWLSYQSRLFYDAGFYTMLPLYEIVAAEGFNTTGQMLFENIDWVDLMEPAGVFYYTADYAGIFSDPDAQSLSAYLLYYERVN